MADACPVCAKHRELEAIVADEHAVVSHLQAGDEPVYLGYLFVEPRRHVAELGDLSADEAASFGRLAALAGDALRRSEGAEHVYAAIIGHGAEHLHLHLIARYPGTPRDYWWVRVDEWPDAPRGDAAAVAELSARLRRTACPPA